MDHFLLVDQSLEVAQVLPVVLGVVQVLEVLLAVVHGVVQVLEVDLEVLLVVVHGAHLGQVVVLDQEVFQEEEEAVVADLGVAQDLDQEVFQVEEEEEEVVVGLGVAQDLDQAVSLEVDPGVVVGLVLVDHSQTNQVLVVLEVASPISRALEIVEHLEVKLEVVEVAMEVVQVVPLLLLEQLLLELKALKGYKLM